MIRRVEFDALLVSLAVEAGAELITEAEIVQAEADATRVRLVARDGRTFEAPVVVAADGVHSVVARRLGIRAGWGASEVALDLMEETPRAKLRDADPSTLWVAYGYEPDGGRDGGDAELDRRRAGAPKRRSGRAAEGYAYIFPKRDHVNVGIGYVLEHYRRTIEMPAYALQRRLVDELRTRGAIEGESVRGNFTPSLIPVGGPLRQPGRGRVLLAGDAGGFVNGFTAEGIYYAMVSGELAARSIARSGGGNQAGVAERYSRACRDEIGAELRDAVTLRRYLFADRRRIARIIEGAKREGAMTKLVLDFALGRLSYPALRLRFFARAPLVAGRLLWEAARTMTGTMMMLRARSSGATIGPVRSSFEDAPGR